MKKLFLESRYTGKINLSKIKLDKLPKKLGLLTTVQFLDYIPKIKTSLEKNKIKVFIGKGKQPNKGQILGCDTSTIESIKNKVEAYLYIGDGRFHPTAVAYKENLPVFTYDIKGGIFSKIKSSEIEKFKKRKKVKLIKFLSAENVGILVSTKLGQNNLKKAKSIKKDLEKKGKTCYILIFETLNTNEFENFSYIDIWINTACPRIAEDHKDIVNYQEINI